MKKIILSLIIILGIFLIGIIFKDITISESIGESDTRIYVKEEGQLSFNDYYMILIDKETNATYLWIKGTNKAGLIVMLDKDGKPLIDKGDEQ